MKAKVKKLAVNAQASIMQTLRLIDSATLGIALVVDDEGVLCGTVTDGDIRRAVMRSVSMDESISVIMNPHPITAPQGTSRVFIENLMKAKRIRHVPIVDENLKLVDIALMSDFIDEPEPNLPCPAVIMAGGLGTRLREVTKDRIPKPLVKVGGQPVLEKIITGLGSQGMDQIFISVNHKKELIEDYFKDGSRFNVDIKYLEEKKRLGTAGALSFLKSRMDSPFIVMNADLLCDIKFPRLLEFHTQSGAAMTVCVRRYGMDIPFGVLNVDKGWVTGLEEKPRKEFFVNAGIYVLEPHVLDLILDDTHMDMTELIDLLVGEGASVGTFPVLNYWIDIGRSADYEKANSEVLQQECLKV